MWTLKAFGALDIRGPGGEPLPMLLAQPKRAALLTYLVLARPGEYHRRDSLLALFWPDLDQSHGRNALSQALSFLRRELGERVLVTRGTGEVGVDADQVRSDVAAFEAARRSEDWSAALEAYGGDLLDGLHVYGAPPFVDWVDRERERLREAASDAAWRFAWERIASMDLVGAERTAQRALTLVPTDESRVRAFIEELANAGDRAAALRFYEKFASVLATELEVDPAPETVRVMEAIRSRSEAVQLASATIPAPIGKAQDPTVPGKPPTDAAIVTGEDRDPLPSTSRFHRRWRRSLGSWGRAGLLLVFATALVGAYEMLREELTGRPEVLAEQGTISRPVPILVADFAAPADTGLGLTVAELLRLEIDQSDVARPVDQGAIGSALRRMERSASAVLDEATAREVAVRDGYPLLVVGRVQQVGGDYVIVARLEEAATGRVLGRFRAAPASSTELVHALGEIGDEVRFAIGESLGSIERSRPLEQVTTPSLEALLLYTEALRLKDREDRPLDAVPLLDRAITLDTTFAAAYVTLDATLQGLMTQWQRQRELSRKAYLYKDRLAEHQRLQVEASYIFNRLVNWDGAPARAPDECGIYEPLARLYAEYAMQHPDELRPLEDYAFYEKRTGQLEDALATYQRILAAIPSHRAYYDVFTTQSEMGRFDEARRTYAEWRTRLGDSGPGSRYLLLAEGGLSARLGEYERADSVAALYETRYGDSNEDVIVERGNIDAAMGRVAEADSLYDRAIHRIEARGDMGRPVVWIANRALMHVVVLGDSVGAMRALTAAVDAVPAGTDLAGTWINVGLAYAIAGDVLHARGALDTLRATGRGNWLLTRSLLAAAIAQAEGAPRRSLELLEASRRPCTFGAGFDLRVDPRFRRILAGRAYEALALRDSAIAEYTAYFADPPLAHPTSLDAVFRFDTLERLGRLLEARGDRAEAAVYYGRAAQLWAGADSALRPRVERLSAHSASLDVPPL